MTSNSDGTTHSDALSRISFRGSDINSLDQLTDEQSKAILAHLSDADDDDLRSSLTREFYNDVWGEVVSSPIGGDMHLMVFFDDYYHTSSINVVRDVRATTISILMDWDIHEADRQEWLVSWGIDEA